MVMVFSLLQADLHYRLKLAMMPAIYHLMLFI